MGVMEYYVIIKKSVNTNICNIDIDFTHRHTCTHTHTHTYTHMTYIVLNKKLSNCFPKWLYHFTFKSTGYMRVPVPPHPHQHLIWSVFLILHILTGKKWYFIVVLINISLMTNYVEHLFMCLFSLYLL
uniref:Uncharacterized protein n=1 Tax=Rousettus aegyptiacus TaxID=9407 RepID=A0A7J8ILY7_ROUAE|nr:hypothetical protein HJG63_010572 [Rousettus aegyptiacus]